MLLTLQLPSGRSVSSRVIASSVRPPTPSYVFKYSYIFTPALHLTDLKTLFVL